MRKYLSGNLGSRIMIVMTLLVIAWLAAMALGVRILVSEKLVKPGQSYAVESYGDLGASQVESLACSYFTGRKIVTRVYNYAPNNILGKDERPFLTSN
jgi:hypothetical protein